MQKTISLRLLPSEAGNDIIVKKYIAQTEGVTVSAISGFIILKQSIAFLAWAGTNLRLLLKIWIR